MKHCMCGCIYLESDCPNCNKVMRADVSTIAANVAATGDHGPTPAGRIRFKLEFAILMLSCGRADEAQAAFARVFDLVDQLDT